MSKNIKKSEVELVVTPQNIKESIYNIRGQQVMIDEDLAQMYDVETKYLNQVVKRNINRFPEKFRFQLTENEYENLRLQIATSKSEDNSLRSQIATLKKEHGKHRKYLPYVFTEQGVSMLSAVLRSETAVKISIQIMDAFVEMRKFITSNALLFQRLDKVEQKQIATDEKFEQLFKALEDKSITPKQGIFYNGQVFDAYTLIADIIRTAKKSIILIDNYVDDTVLKLFTKRKKKVSTTIYTKTISKVLKQDLEKHNTQYEPIDVKQLKTAHDRFIIIDEKTIFHLGASLKDLGKKWFAFSKLEIDVKEIIKKL
jgi:hypothetical protein